MWAKPFQVSASRFTLKNPTIIHAKRQGRLKSVPSQSWVLWCYHLHLEATGSCRRNEEDHRKRPLAWKQHPQHLAHKVMCRCSMKHLMKFWRRAGNLGTQAVQTLCPGACIFDGAKKILPELSHSSIKRVSRVQFRQLLCYAHCKQSIKVRAWTSTEIHLTVTYPVLHLLNWHKTVRHAISINVSQICFVRWAITSAGYF